MALLQSRREFTASLSLAGTAGLLGASVLADDGAAGDDDGAPAQGELGHLHRADLVAEELVRAEGFSDVRLSISRPAAADVRDGRQRAAGHLAWLRAGGVVRQMDVGTPITVLAGVHPGLPGAVRPRAGQRHQGPEGQERRHSPRTRLCAAASSSSSWRPMSGSTRPGTSTGSRAPRSTPWRLFAAGKVDAFFGGPPDAQELRSRNIGRVIFRTATDRPWSQYFCCVLVGKRLCPQLSGCHQAPRPRDSQGHRHVRRRADGGRRRFWSKAGPPPATTMRCR